MGSTKDEKLSKKQGKGLLKKEFDKIDANKEGFLIKEELQKAPKPKNHRCLE